MYLHLSDIYPTFKLVPLSAVHYTGMSIKILETFLKLFFNAQVVPTFHIGK